MKIYILDTNRLYTEMLSLPDNERTSFFDKEFIQPFVPFLDCMNMPRDPDMLGYLALTGSDHIACDMLKKLNNYDVWNATQHAIEFAESNLKKTDILLPEELLLGIFLGNPTMLAQSEGYTGIGSVPGYIQLIVAPNEYNLPRISSCAAHEFHHNVLFKNIKWNFMNVTLSQYLAVEGLAESFAAELYGKEFIGPWVTNVSLTDLEKTRGIIGQALDTAGFMEVRKYMYGDHPMVPEGSALGIPYCGGYAIGYHAIQAYLHNTSKTVAEATNAYISGEDIIKQSGYFL